MRQRRSEKVREGQIRSERVREGQRRSEKAREGKRRLEKVGWKRLENVGERHIKFEKVR